jgi:hypothetical protein
MKDQVWHKDKDGYGLELAYSLNAVSTGGLICVKVYS